MSTKPKPLFVATHPRSCSTAFERVFMTRSDILNCIHEPFGDAFYFGPERLSDRYAGDEKTRAESGFGNVRFRDVVDSLMSEVEKDKRVVIKDIIHYLFPPQGQPAQIAPSLSSVEGEDNSSKHGSGTNGITNGNSSSHTQNPTVIPTSILSQFHFTFLIRHPRRAIPSYYRCTIPPLDKVTGFYHFLPSEAGYDELRRMFDFLRSEKIIGPRLADASDSGPEPGEVRVTVVDADDLLDRPEEVIRAYCREVGIDFTPAMLNWGGDDEEAQQKVKEKFEKWNGFHDDAIGSTELKPRAHALKTPTIEEENAQWREKFGKEAQEVIRACVDANVADYEYLKGFALKF